MSMLMTFLQNQQTMFNFNVNLSQFLNNSHRYQIDLKLIVHFLTHLPMQN